MGNRMDSKVAICPYCKQERLQMVCCEGFEEGTVLRISFSDRGKALRYKNNRCRSVFVFCPMFQKLSEKVL